MNIIVIFLSGAVTALIIRSWLVKGKIAVPVPVKTGDINIYELTQKIDILSNLKNQLFEIEDMITEIESAEQGERGIALNLSMPTNDTKYNFLVNNQSSAILELLYSERKKIRFSIVNELSEIQIQSTILSK